MKESTEEDKILVQEFIDGKEEAFNRLMIKYQRKVYSIARKMLGDHDEANDVSQEVFLVVYNKLKGFRFESSFYTWIYRITVTRSLNAIKKNKLRRFFGFGNDNQPEIRTEEGVTGAMESKEEFAKLEKSLQKLPAKQREVFILRHFEELSYEEISQITQTSVGALKANYFHAFNKIEQLMR